MKFMNKLWRRVTNDESGQAILATLVCLLLGGILIASCFGYINTVLKNRASMERGTRGLYAADAGVEDVLWCLSNGVSLHTALPQNLNGNQVSMQNELIGDYSLYAGEWITADSHNSWLLVSGDIVWDEVAEAYKYTITVTWNAESGTTIHLSEVGAKLPIGYTYQTDSAALFGDNLSIDEPEDTLDSDDAHLLKWIFSAPRPSVSESDPTQTEVFYITGEDTLDNYYAWVVASREDIGYVSELNGTFYRVTTTATCIETSEVTASIITDILLSEGTTYIMSWQINQN